MKRVRPLHAYALLAIVVLVFMGRLLVCDFTWWDDGMNLHQNLQMNPVKLDTFIDNWTQPSAAIYIPLTFTVWALLAIIAQVSVGEYGIALNPYIFHAANLLVHLAGAIAAWHLLRRLVRNDIAALLGAMLWAIHPVQVESVGWISGMKDVLAGSLTIACLWQYVRWRQDAVRRSYWISLVFYVLAMLAKPSAMTTPLLLIVIDRLALKSEWKEIFRAIFLFVLVTLPIAIIARVVQPAYAARHPLWMRPFIVGDSLAFYIVKVLAPIRLAFDYGRNPDFLRRTGEMWYTWLLPVSIAAIAIGLYVFRNRRGQVSSMLPGVALLLFALAPLHVLGLTQFDFQVISTVSDHYLYVAMIGPALLFAWLISTHEKHLLTPAILIICALGIRSALQEPVWQNEHSLMTHALSVNPDSWTAYNNLASEANRKDENQEQLVLLQKAEALNDGEPQIQASLMSTELRLNHGPEAERHARRIIQQYDDFWKDNRERTVAGFVKVINIYVTYRLLDDAQRYTQEGLARSPDNPDLKSWAQNIQSMRAEPSYRPRTSHAFDNPTTAALLPPTTSRTTLP